MIWSLVILIGVFALIELVQGEAVCNADGICSSTKRRPMIAGNWKMNTDLNSAVLLTSEIIKLTNGMNNDDVDIALFPPYPFIRDVWKTLQDTNPAGIRVGAQSVYFETKGAFTAAVSAPMLKSVGTELVLVGHSERRSVFGETDQDINKSLKQVIVHGMVPVLCVGETLEEFEQGVNKEVIAVQLGKGLAGLTADQLLTSGIIIAYEPVWAIGTGRVATPAIAQHIHSHIRTWLRIQYGEAVSTAVRILYGGSVTAANAALLLAETDIDGALVGGASLKADSFKQIIYAAVQQ